MAFPTISIKTTNYTLTPNLQVLIEQKFSPLDKFLDERNESFCEIELEKIGDQQSGKIFRAEVNLENGGKLYRAEATEEQMEQAIDVIKNEVRAELQRAHGKRQSLVRRGGQALKNMLRFGK